jgi:Family of unknown function (DUF5709)
MESDETEEWDAVEDDGVLDGSDTLDDNPVSDPLDTGIAAPDRWAGADRFGTTIAEQGAGESLEQLLAEEQPDVDPYGASGADDPYGPSVDPYGPSVDVDDEDELIRRGYEVEPRSGRLLADGEGFGDDQEADLVAQDVGIDAGAASAEEAAVHVVDDPDGPGDGPLR